MKVEEGLDARAFARVKLTPPDPLPYVSRRALMRVRDWVHIPKQCHVCDRDGVVLVNNTEVYGRPFGKWPYCYLCRGCGAYVSLHPDTDLPQGFMADSFIRDARKAAKIPFLCICRIKFEKTTEGYCPKRQRMVKITKVDRNAAYKWLANRAGIEKKLCHFAMFDEETAIRVFHICYNYIFEEC